MQKQLTLLVMVLALLSPGLPILCSTVDGIVSDHIPLSSYRYSTKMVITKICFVCWLARAILGRAGL